MKSYRSPTISPAPSIGSAEGVNTVRTNVQGEIESSINDINTQFQTIDDLNRKISTSTAQGQTEPDLEDKRDEAVRLVAEQIDINVMKRSDGTISILDHYGQPFLEDDYKPLSIGTTVINPQAAYPGAIPPIRLGDPTTGKDVTNQLRGGKLGALIQLRDQKSAALPGPARRIFPDAVRDVQHRRSDAVHRHQRAVPAELARHGIDRLRQPDPGFPDRTEQSRPCCATATPRLRRGRPTAPCCATIVDSVLGPSRRFRQAALAPTRPFRLRCRLARILHRSPLRW